MQFTSLDLLGALGLQHPDFLVDLDPLAAPPRPPSTASSPISSPVTPYAPPHALLGSMSSNSSSSSFMSVGEVSGQSSTPWSTGESFDSTKQYFDFPALLDNPYFGFSNPPRRELPQPFLPSPSTYNSQQPQYPTSLVPDLLGTLGGPFKGPDAIAFESIDPSMLQADTSSFRPAFSGNMYAIHQLPASLLHDNDSYPVSVSPPDMSASASPAHASASRQDRKAPRAHRWSHGDSLRIDTSGSTFGAIPPGAASAPGAYDRPFSASSSTSIAPASEAVKPRKMSESAVHPGGRLGFDAAQREKEFETLYMETGGNPSKRDRRRLQNRLAQRAFRARSKVVNAETGRRRSSVSDSRSPPARSRPSQ